MQRDEHPVVSHQIILKRQFYLVCNIIVISYYQAKKGFVILQTLLQSNSNWL